MTALAWWVVCPPAEQNASSVPSDALIISTPVGSADYETLLNTDSGTFAVGGRPYVRYMGPFGSEADAASAVPVTSGGLPFEIGTGVGIGLLHQPASAAVQTGLAAENAASKLTGWTANIQKWLIRGFEMLLGIGLIVVAVAKLASDTSAGRAAASVGKAVVL